MAGLCVQCIHTQEGSAEERINIRLHGTQFLFPILTCSAQGLLASMKNLPPAAECQTSDFLLIYCFRQTTQDAPEEVRNRDFRRELEERERVAAREKNRDRPTRGKTKKQKSNSFVKYCSCMKFGVVRSLQLQTACHESRI